MKVKQKGEKEKKKIVLIIKLLKDTDFYRKSTIEYFKCQIDHFYLLVFKVVSQFPCVIQDNQSLCVCVCYSVFMKFTYVTHVTHDVLEPTAFVALMGVQATLSLFLHTGPFPVLGRPTVPGSFSITAQSQHHSIS